MASAISIENVSKTYRLGAIGGGTLREDLSRWWAKARNKPDPNAKIGQDAHARTIGDKFWALRDVSLQVKQGEILGVVGRNGAGKSTLLKILSRVTGPTEGKVKIKGRIASLLEVGTGFHPELTGMENIFLNGTILGMTKADIRRKLDEIVAFSEIGEFIDTPVKRYSSGMYVRLAFAVAAHLEPEILIVDEVLAVGDAQFQKKCLGKMQDASSREGRTVLFVSHNLEAVMRLCSRAVWMQGGEVVGDGTAHDIVPRYLRPASTQPVTVDISDRDRPGYIRVRHARVKAVVSPPGPVPWSIPFGEPLTFEAVAEVWKTREHLEFRYSVFTATTFEVAAGAEQIAPRCEPGEHRVKVEIFHLRLLPGRYVMTVALRSSEGDEDLLMEAFSFEVVSNQLAADMKLDQIGAACFTETRVTLKTPVESPRLS